ncbi:uncharacterized protein LOC110621191 isoform X2 [Manihot esculenta]|uniref:uncharacterized protein LOC110621191 isoform X2 n=1 Tax=Manihot esculenta TaxID=3983 RepID=UPI000B5D34EA|nr:uncharacterized protein LOC110621191 isoform X2 [Manihot esculenta]
MSYSCAITPPSSINACISAAHRPWHSGKNKARPQAKTNEQLWRCVEACGACCKLAKGPSFATPEEIFTDPSDIELYRSLIGPDGWCIHFDKSTRKCSIYPGKFLSLITFIVKSTNLAPPILLVFRILLSLYRSSIFLSRGARCVSLTLWNWQEEIQQRGLQMLSRHY